MKKSKVVLIGNFDGIHLGQEDKNCKEAKKLFGINFQVGVSCNDSIEIYKKSNS